MIYGVAFENNNIPIGSFSSNFKKYHQESSNSILYHLSKTYRTYYDYEEAFENASEGGLVMAESKLFLEYNVRKRFTDE